MTEGALLSVLEGTARWSVVHSDCLDVLREMPDECVDAIVTDAPYGLSKITEADAREALACWLRGEPYLTSQKGFMGRTWDRFVPGPEVWRECCRVLRPGGHLLTFAGTRTEDLMGIALRLGGLERIDTIEWLYASGFPKSVNLERAVAMDQCALPGRHFASTLPRGAKLQPGDHLCPETEESRRWKGYGSALKPAHEPILVCRKPLAGTYAENVQAHGTAMSIEACRVGVTGGIGEILGYREKQSDGWGLLDPVKGESEHGRWPPNTVIQHAPGCVRTGTRAVAAHPTWDTPNRATEPSVFTGDAVSQVRHGVTSFQMQPGRKIDVEDVEVWECVDGCPAKALGAMSGESSSPPVGSVCNFTRQASSHTVSTGAACLPNGHGDSGTATRFFPQFSDEPPFLYQAKPSRAEKDRGLQHFRRRTGADATDSEEEQQRLESPRTGAGRTGGARNCHPTSKSVDLLRWLTRLVARPGQVVFNPFAGGGSEGVAAVLEGCRWIGVEINDSDEEPFVSIARARLLHLEGGEFIPRESLRAPVKERPAQATLFGGTP